MCKSRLELDLGGDTDLSFCSRVMYQSKTAVSAYTRHRLTDRSVLQENNGIIRTLNRRDLEKVIKRT